VLDNKGTDFILAFMPNFSNGNVELHLTSDVNTSVTVEYPVTSPTFTTTVAVTPGSVTVVSLPVSAAQSWTPDVVANNAVRAFAPDEFVVYMINRVSATSDAALGLPVDTMNTEYIVMDYNPFFVGAEFIVYAAFDNTEVTITPANDIVGHLAGSPFSVVLNRGEGFFGRSSVISGPEGTLTGTIISADRPVGLINGDGCTQIPTGTTACDHIFEVAQPVQSWGMEALVANLPNRPNGSIYRILASQDETTVTQDGASLGTINRGEFIETPILAGDHVFAGDEPIFVSQFMPGQNSLEARLGDPAMGNMVPTDQYLSAYTFSTVGGGQFAENFLTVIAENADVGALLLDGAPIPADDFTSIGSSGFSAAVVTLTEGTHTTSSNGIHGITVQGFNSFDSYIYPGGALFRFINIDDTFVPAVSVTTIGDTFQGLATDSEDANANGVFDPGEDLNNNSVIDPRSEDLNNNGFLDPGEDFNVDNILDEDKGVFVVALDPGAVNLSLTVSPFEPGASAVEFTVEVVNPLLPAAGVIRVTDGGGNEATVSISVGGNQPPVLDPIGGKGTRPGSLLEFTVSATDPDGDTVFLSIGTGGLPADATFNATPGNPATGVFSWTPESEQEGLLSTVNFVATDNGFPPLMHAEAVLLGVGKYPSPNTNTDPNNFDTDDDGTDDGTEIAQGTDPLNPLN
jgi:hypothetical protein